MPSLVFHAFASRSLSPGSRTSPARTRRLSLCVQSRLNIIGLYRVNAIAIESEARDPFGGNVYYVTMQIMLPIPEFVRKERNLHRDVVHITTKGL